MSSFRQPQWFEIEQKIDIDFFNQSTHFKPMFHLKIP
jgi:hypothetical protein